MVMVVGIESNMDIHCDSVGYFINHYRDSYQINSSPQGRQQVKL